MSTTIIETPAGVAPGRIVGHVRVPPALPQVSVREFNRDPLDRSDPLEGAGTNIESFGVSVSYPVARSKHPAVLVLKTNPLTRTS